MSARFPLAFVAPLTLLTGCFLFAEGGEDSGEGLDAEALAAESPCGIAQIDHKLSLKPEGNKDTDWVAEEFEGAGPLSCSNWDEFTVRVGGRAIRCEYAEAPAFTCAYDTDEASSDDYSERVRLEGVWSDSEGTGTFYTSIWEPGDASESEGEFQLRLDSE